MKLNFRLPNTRLCVVVWFRNGQKNEVLIDTPYNNETLRNKMLMDHAVGFSEIRAVKGVDSSGLLRQLV